MWAVWGFLGLSVTMCLLFYTFWTNNCSTTQNWCDTYLNKWSSGTAWSLLITSLHLYVTYVFYYVYLLYCFFLPSPAVYYCLLKWRQTVGAVKFHCGKQHCILKGTNNSSLTAGLPWIVPERIQCSLGQGFFFFFFKWLKLQRNKVHTFCINCCAYPEARCPRPRLKLLWWMTCLLWHRGPAYMSMKWLILYVGK